MDAAKTTEISRRILAKVAEGLSLPEAFDAVLGDGRYDALAGEVYAALREGGAP